MENTYILTYLQKKALFVSAFVLIFSWSLSAPSLAEAVEQTVRIDVTKPADGLVPGAGGVQGDHDNCNQRQRQGARRLQQESGCICTAPGKTCHRQIDDKQSFTIASTRAALILFVTRATAMQFQK